MYLQIIEIFKNPFVIAGCIYIIMLLIQILISISTLRNKMEKLVAGLDYDKKEIRKMFIMSILLTPISTLYWIKSLFYRKLEIEK